MDLSSHYYGSLFQSKLTGIEIKIFHFHNLQDVLDDNFDIELTIPSGERYAATLFTIKNIEKLMRKNKNDCLEEPYFWCPDMIIIESFENSALEEFFNSIIRNETYKKVMKNLGPPLIFD